MKYEIEYKEALERAMKLYKQGTFKETLSYIFPELAESEDEKIRKTLIEYFNAYPKDYYGELKKSHILAWIKKQGESTLIEEIKRRKELYSQEKEKTVSSIEKLSLGGRIAMLEELCAFIDVKQGEQKPTDKVEPKFKVGDTMRTLQEANDGYTDGMPVVVSIDNEYYHCTNELIAIKDQDDYEFPPMNVKQKHNDKPKFKVGDWVVDEEDNYVYQVRRVISNVSNGTFSYDLTDSGYFYSTKTNCHLWTIADAKDGDVLTGKIDGDDYILIFKQIKDGWIETYGHYYDAVDRFCVPSQLFCRDCKGTFYPATEEQRDLLFKKMKEAGYEWDADVKELKKIHIIDEGKAEMDYCFTKMMNGEKVCPAWSEDDEETLGWLCTFLKDYGNPFYEGNEENVIDWLKSLKERIGG